MQVPGGGPEGREGLPPLLGFVGFGTDPEPLPNGPDEPPPPFPPPPGDEFDALPPGLPPPGPPPPGLPDEARFPTPPIAFPELPPPPGLVVVTGEPAPGVRGDRPEPAPNGSSEGMSPFSLAPDGEFDALPPGLSEEARFPTSAIAFPELPPPPGLVAVTGEPAPGDRCMGPEGGFNGSE
jgi:small nuclear ribonucleoprotein B and B'